MRQHSLRQAWGWGGVPLCLGTIFFLATPSLLLGLSRGQGAQAKLERLHCHLAAEQKMLLAPGLNIALPPGKRSYDFEISGLYYGEAYLHDPRRPGARRLDLLRHSASIDLTYRDTYYTENYEYYPESGQLDYTEVYHFLDSEPEVIVGTGRCRAKEKSGV